jgi:hypothetical protein
MFHSTSKKVKLIDRSPRRAVISMMKFASVVLALLAALLCTATAGAAVGAVQSSALRVRGGDILPPAALYENAVAYGEKKAALPASKVLKLAMISGAHIAVGGCLAVQVGGNMRECTLACFFRPDVR